MARKSAHSSANTPSRTTSSQATTTTSSTTVSTPSTTTVSSTTTTTTTTIPVSKDRSSLKTSTASNASTSAFDLRPIIVDIWDNYTKTTPQRTKLIDAFMAFLVAVGGVQFVYCVLFGNYPYNAFLSGFGITVGQFVLTASLRIQTNVENAAEFKSVSPERAFADYVLGSLVLHFFCVNFIN